MPRDSQAFACEMSLFFANEPDMATQIKAKAAHYRFANLPNLVQAYNSRFPVK